MMVSSFLRSKITAYIRPVYKKIQGTISSAQIQFSSVPKASEEWSFQFRDGTSVKSRDGQQSPLERFKVPYPPKPVKLAFEIFHEEKMLAAARAKPPVSYSLKDSKYTWDCVREGDKANYNNAAVKDLIRYKQQLAEYNAVMSSQVSIAQMIEWIKSPEGKKIVKEMMGIAHMAENQARIKKPRSGYMYYVTHYKATISSGDPLRVIGEKWRSLSPEEKAPFLQEATVDRKRYKLEIEASKQDPLRKEEEGEEKSQSQEEKKNI